jgi:hypothetical protein
MTDELSSAIRKYVLSVVDERINDAMNLHMDDAHCASTTSFPYPPPPKPVCTVVEWWRPEQKMPEPGRHVLVQDPTGFTREWFADGGWTKRYEWWCYVPLLPKRNT